MAPPARGPRAGPRVLVVDLAATSKNWALPPDGADAIRAHAPPGWTVRVVDAPTVSDGDGGPGPSPEALAAVRDAEVYFGFGFSRALLGAAPGLRWVQSAAAGVGSVLFPEMIASPVLITNAAGVHAVPIAEHVVGGLLYLLRGLDIAVAQQRDGRWDKAPFVGGGSRLRELGACRALIVGTGGIGQAVASRLRAFGTVCTGVRRRARLGAPAGFDRVAPVDQLDAELPGADIVILAAPLTPLTRDLLSARRLALLPHDAIVVNVARGALLDEAALVDALRADRLGGAVLDVFGEEPLAAASALWQLPHVLLTPHVSAVSPGRFWTRELALFFDNWRRHVAGEPLTNLVDKQAGY